MIEYDQMKHDFECMQKREEAIVSWLDLDEIDLITERLKVFSGRDSENSSSKILWKPNKLVPALDLSKIYEWRKVQNQEDSE